MNVVFLRNHELDFNKFIIGLCSIEKKSSLAFSLLLSFTYPLLSRIRQARWDRIVQRFHSQWIFDRIFVSSSHIQFDVQSTYELDVVLNFLSDVHQALRILRWCRQLLWLSLGSSFPFLCVVSVLREMCEIFTGSVVSFLLYRCILVELIWTSYLESMSWKLIWIPTKIMVRN